MANYTIQNRLTAASMLTAVPPAYRLRLRRAGQDEEYTLVVFRHNREDVILSPTVRTALAELPEMPGTVVVIGGCFTAEALEILAAMRAIVLQLRDFHWTDESYKRLRVRYR